MGSKSNRLKLAKALVEQAKGIIRAQINVVQTQVTQQIESYLKQVVDGSWKGEDAEQFKVDLQSKLIPKLNQATDMTTRMNVGIESAVTIIEQTDGKVSQMVADLNGVFTKIY